MQYVKMNEEIVEKSRKHKEQLTLLAANLESRSNQPSQTSFTDAVNINVQTSALIKPIAIGS